MDTSNLRSLTFCTFVATTEHPAKDYYWTKFVFSNLRYPVKSASLRIGGKDHPMKLIGGYWGAWTGPINGDTSFKITEENGYTATSRKLFGSFFWSCFVSFSI